MKEKQQFEVWREDVEPALISKLDEFHFLGYERVTIEEIWECVLYQLRKQKGFLHFHAFVNQVMTLKPQTYMNWLTVKSYQEPADWFAEFEAEK